jgi:hypothetical protein
VRGWGRFAFWLGLLTAAPCALAQNRSVSYSTWTVAAQTVTVRFVLPGQEARGLIGSEVPVLTTSKLGDYLLKHLAVQSGDRSCPAIDQGYDLGQVDPLAVGDGYYGFELIFRCAGMKDLVLKNRAVFERAPSHINFASIEWNGRRSEQLFTREQQEVRLPAQGDLPSAGVGRYLRLGIAHILHSPDRLCLLVALLVLWRRRQDGSYVLIGLAGGYALALGVSATSGAVPRINLLEASFGLMIGVLAIAIVLPQIHRPRRVAIAAWPALLILLALVALGRHAPIAALMLAGAALFAGCFLAIATASPGQALIRLLPAAVFGFLDGFVLPSMQAVMQLPKRVQLPLLVGFDFGACLTAAFLVALLAGLFLALRGQQLVRDRWPLNEVAAACLGAVGSFWLLTRLQI